MFRWFDFAGIISLSVLAAAGLPAESPDSVEVPAQPDRYFEDGVFISEATPPLKMQVDEAFEYVGSIQFILKDTAVVDRHHFVATRGSSVKRMIVLQFEGFLDGVENIYRGGIPTAELEGSNYRFTDQFVPLGDQDYIHNTWAFDLTANAAENPGAESEQTLEFLKEAGYRLEDGWIMSRYMRVVGLDRRNELIIFYMESLTLGGHSIDEFPDGDPASQTYNTYSSAVSRRARRSFEVMSLVRDAE